MNALRDVRTLQECCDDYNAKLLEQHRSEKKDYETDEEFEERFKHKIKFYTSFDQEHFWDEEVGSYLDEAGFCTQKKIAGVSKVLKSWQFRFVSHFFYKDVYDPEWFDEKIVGMTKEEWENRDYKEYILGDRNISLLEEFNEQERKIVLAAERAFLLDKIRIEKDKSYAKKVYEKDSELFFRHKEITKKMQDEIQEFRVLSSLRSFGCETGYTNYYLDPSLKGFYTALLNAKLYKDLKEEEEYVSKIRTISDFFYSRYQAMMCPKFNRFEDIKKHKEEWERKTFLEKTKALAKAILEERNRNYRSFFNEYRNSNWFVFLFLFNPYTYITSYFLQKIVFVPIVAYRILSPKICDITAIKH